MALLAVSARSKVLPVHERLVSEFLEAKRDTLNTISQEIWTHPETMYEEVYAHRYLTDFLSSHGFVVQPNYKDVATAFRAEFCSTNFDKSVHATVAVLCEYDALPGIGHACGHNLIAEAGIAAGWALQEILKNSFASGREERVEGRVVVLGCPAEEGGGGKVDLIEGCAFDDIDFAMMVHPYPWNDIEPIILGIERCLVTFHGRAAHASCGPWEGINALDAAVATYQNVSLFRQQMQPNWRIHGIIVNGGAKPNIIPDLTVSYYNVRTQTQADMEVLKSKMVTIFGAAAKATGCTFDVTWEPKPYCAMMHNSTMLSMYKRFSLEEGIVFPDNVPGYYGSTDMGNVSVVVPSIQPAIFIGQPYPIHTKEMERQAGSAEAQDYVLKAAKSMVLTSVELFLNEECRDKVKQEFQEKKSTFTG